MKTLRVTLADIIGPTGTPNSTATVHARYVDTSGRGRDVHLTDGTIVVPVRRSVAPGTGPEEFDFTVIPSDDGDVREVDQGFLTEVSWTVTAPEGGKSHGARRVLITADMGATVHLGLLSTPAPLPGYTGGYVTPETYAALVARVAELEAAPGGGGSDSLTIVASGAATLPSSPTVGDLVGFQFTGAGTIAGVAVTAGVWIARWDGTQWFVVEVTGWVGAEPVDPGDVTAPTAGTLAGSAITSSGFTLTVAGADDETALHATPYAFSTNGGSSYSAWQAGATYAATGLTESTGYSCRHQVRDAAGNVATGTAVTVTTSAGADVVAPTTPTGLTATAASSTSVNLAWTASTDAVGVTGYEYRIDGGTAVDAGAGVAETVTGLTASTEYDFEVRAYDAAGNRSGWSSVATETTDAGWTPASLTALAHWWSAQAPANYTESGGVISQMNDLVGSAHMTQATAGLRPALVASSVNGHPVAQFATDDILATGAAAISDTGSFTVWGIIRQDAGSAAHVDAVRVNANTGHSGGWGWNTPAYAFPALTKFDYVHVAYGGGAVPSTAHVFAVTLEAGTVTQYMNSTSALLDGGALGRNIVAAALGTGAAVSVCEVGILTTPISAGDWADLHTYAQTRYGTA